MNNIKLNNLSQRVLFITDIEKIIGRNRLTLRRWWMDGKFPVPVKLNGTTLAWHTETINDWIEQNTRSNALSTAKCNSGYKMNMN